MTRIHSPAALLLLFFSFGLCCQLSVTAAFSDDAPFFGTAAHVYPIRESRVRMLKEVVTIRKATGKKKIAAGAYEADCTFLFKNETGERLDVQMGFPDWEISSEGEKRGWAIRSFEVKRNGKPVRAVHKQVSLDGELADNAADLSPKLAEDFPNYVTGAYTWQVKFGPHEQVELHNRYLFGGTEGRQSIQECARDVPAADIDELFWRKAPCAFPSNAAAADSNPETPNPADSQSLCPIDGWDYARDAYCSSVDYIVTTGRSWNGSIGEADIFIEIDRTKLPHLLFPSPPPAEVSEDRVHWHFRDWTPSRDVHLIYFNLDSFAEGRAQPLFNSVAQAEAWGGFAKRNNLPAVFVDRLLAAYRSLNAATDVDGKPIPVSEEERRIQQLLPKLRTLLGK